MALYPCHSRRSGNPGPDRMTGKQLKKWERVSKIRLIEESNPRWEDLCPPLG